MNRDAIEHWAGVLGQCAQMVPAANRSLPSPTLALLRRLSSNYARSAL